MLFEILFFLIKFDIFICYKVFTISYPSSLPPSLLTIFYSYSYTHIQTIDFPLHPIKGGWREISRKRVVSFPQIIDKNLT